VTNFGISYTSSQPTLGLNGTTAQGALDQTYSGPQTGYAWGPTGYGGGTPSINTTYSTNVGGSTIYGQWAQVSLNAGASISLTSWSFWCQSNTGYGTSAIYQFTLAGSNDGSTWSSIATQTNCSPFEGGLIHTYNFTGKPYYRYIRFIIQSVNGNDVAYVRGMGFSGYYLATPILLSNSSMSYTASQSAPALNGSLFANALNQTYTAPITSNGYNWGPLGYGGGGGNVNTGYSTTVSGSTSYGQWGQISLSTFHSVSITSLSWWCYADGNGTGKSTIYQFTLAGSNDGTTWSLIYTASNCAPFDGSIHTFTMSGKPFYQYIRFIVNSINGNDALYLYGLNFSGYYY
jgi:hypothetical protein